jgi:TonB-like protein
MFRRISSCLLAIACGVAVAQTTRTQMPENLVIARHTFFDFGPPNDFYEVIQVESAGSHLSVKRALITPQGGSCVQPPTIEQSTVAMHETMDELLSSKNPCSIPDKELHRELKRCKKCLTFRGVIVTMQTSCHGLNRQIRMDILDHDLFDSSPGTPENTSWTMSLLAKLDTALGPGAMDKPVFSLGSSQAQVPEKTELIQQITEGKFDTLFGTEDKVSLIAQQAMKPPPLPTVEIESVSPTVPTSVELPKYPPIAKLARVEGLVEATFHVDEDGTIKDIAFHEARLKMLQLGVTESIPKWKFPQSAWGKDEKALIRFRLNCNTIQSEPTLKN